MWCRHIVLTTELGTGHCIGMVVRESENSRIENVDFVKSRGVGGIEATLLAEAFKDPVRINLDVLLCQFSLPGLSIIPRSFISFATT